MLARDDEAMVREGHAKERRRRHPGDRCRRVEISFCGVQKVGDGKLASTRPYSDMAGMLAQRGLVPAPGAAGRRRATARGGVRM